MGARFGQKLRGIRKWLHSDALLDPWVVWEVGIMLDSDSLVPMVWHCSLVLDDAFLSFPAAGATAAGTVWTRTLLMYSA